MINITIDDIIDYYKISISDVEGELAVDIFEDVGLDQVQNVRHPVVGQPPPLLHHLLQHQHQLIARIFVQGQRYLVDHLQAKHQSLPSCFLVPVVTLLPCTQQLFNDSSADTGYVSQKNIFLKVVFFIIL